MRILYWWHTDYLWKLVFCMSRNANTEKRSGQNFTAKEERIQAIIEMVKRIRAHRTIMRIYYFVYRLYAQEKN